MRSHILVLSGLFGVASACAPAGESQTSGNEAVAPPAISAAAEPAESGQAKHDWQATVFRRIADGEYALRRDDAGLRARNRAQALNARWSERGTSLAQLGNEAGAAAAEPNVVFRTVAITRGAERLSASSDAFGAGSCRKDGALDEAGECLKRAESRQDGWLEWWENRAEGLEQGWDLSEAPLLSAGARPFRVIVQVEGAKVVVNENGGAATLETATGRKLTYDKLAAFDADRQALPVKLVADEHGMALEVDDRNAHYPIQIDPTITATWQVEMNQEYSNYGNVVTSAGDMNGDGYGELAVSAPLYDIGGGFGTEGRVLIYKGSATGLSTTATWTLDGDAVQRTLGVGLAGAGDMNGDGFDDLVVSAATPSGAGRVYVYGGSVSGLNSTPLLTVDGSTRLERFGLSVASAGDVNKDGFADIVVGAPDFSTDGGGFHEGRAYVFHGKSGVLSKVPARILNATAGTFGRLGMSVATSGDVNGDGYSDVIVGAPNYSNGQANEGAVFVYHGSSTGVAATPTITLESGSVGANLGTAVAGIGDCDGDGYADVAAGEPFLTSGQTSEGAVLVYKGSSSGLAASSTWQIESNVERSFMGKAVASAGDINGDGRADLVVGAPEENVHMGVVRFYTWDSTGPKLYNQVNATVAGNLGSSVASAGDVNGDGLSDVVAGMPLYANGQWFEGSAYLYLGRSSMASSAAVWRDESNKASAQYGKQVASAGDVNADGYDDVIVGAPSYSDTLTNQGRAYLYYGGPTGLAATPSWTAQGDQAAGTFGASVASARDVNNDGIGDVIIGIPHYANGQADEGRAVMYFGSTTGLPAAPSWIAESDFTDTDFGASVASAGDVNGDGISDIVVGAPDFTNGEAHEGRVYVYHGRSGQAPLTTPTTTREVNLAGARFGESVAGAGDVNRDGFDDLLVGAPKSTNVESEEGRAFVYKGTSTGVAASALWTAEPNLERASFGFSVAAAGDINADGFADILVGAPSYSTGGQAFLYAGSATGPATTATVTLSAGATTSSQYGHSVAGVGDLNGDGYADIAVGAPDAAGARGEVFVWSGSVTGLSASWVWKVRGAKIGGKYGSSVSAADANGDGYSDVLVGAMGYTNGQTGEGRAFLYFGNEADFATGGGLPLLPMARKVGLTKRIVAGATSGLDTGFDATWLSARGPMGRSRVKLQVEAKPRGTAFNGAGFLTSAWTDTGLAGAVLKVNVPPMATAAGRQLHYRARLIYGPSSAPWYQHSRWIYGDAGSPAGMHVRIP